MQVAVCALLVHTVGTKCSVYGLVYWIVYFRLQHIYIYITIYIYTYMYIYIYTYVETVCLRVSSTRPAKTLSPLMSTLVQNVALAKTPLSSAIPSSCRYSMDLPNNQELLQN